MRTALDINITRAGKMTTNILKITILSLIVGGLMSCGKGGEWKEEGLRSCGNAKFKHYTASVELSIDESAKMYQTDIESAINEVNAVMNHPIFKLVSSSKNVIRVGSATPKGELFVQTTKVANAITSTNFKGLYVDSFTITIRDTIPQGMFDMNTLVKHEIIHEAGIGHSNDKNSVMYPYSSTVYQVIDADTVNTLNCLYNQ